MSKPSAQWLHSPLAIVGMACRLPGADGLEQFWDLLNRGGYAVERMPDSKLDRQLYFDPEKGKRCKTYSQVGGFVQERELDWSLLNIRPEDTYQWDQCHLALCEVVARACQNAGYNPKNLPNRNVGVFVGHSGGTTLGGDLAYRNLVEEYVQLLADLPEWQKVGSSDALNQLRERLTQNRPQRQLGGKPYVDAGFASGLISHNFGLTGPHMSIDAACASSLVALALGSMSLACGQAEMAIIGGASYNKADSLVLFSAAQSCSSQMSRPFDQGADGLISAEGYVAILVKPLDKAHRDGNQIHAVIRGIGYSSDGRGRSLWAPRHEGQSTAIERAYPSDIDPNSVQLIEAHATSTQVGDATEMEALASFYAPRLSPGQRLPVGSVKSNIGHTLETAGLAGLVKSVLAIQHGVIPPSINLQNPNQSIPWPSIPFYVPKTAQPWPALPEGQPRRAAVNAFGIGGLNVHVVVDQAFPQSRQLTQSNQSTQSSQSTQASQLTHPATQFVHVRGQRETAADDSTLIAVVGRGLVVPGANSLAEYQAALASPLKASAHGKVELTHRVQFEYDWRKHKVPPKQVANANPLQFMLLEAAEQALVEAGLLQSDTFDRAKSAVVVGSIFGGDFGNELFAGLRLPEFRDRLHSVIISRGLDNACASQICEQFEQKFLKHYPALLDETGSFTSSTLASRIAKTFNLMGGAMAIDAGDCSGLAALRSACWLLQSGSVSTVLCAAAQRALDRAALENLRLCGRLKQSTTNNADSQGYAIGEGVVLLVLKRLSDAELAGDKILAIVDQVNFGYDNNSLARSVEIAASGCQVEASNDGRAAIVGSLGIAPLDHQVSQALQSSSAAPVLLKQPANLNRTGHLQGAQGLLDVVNCTLDLTRRKQWVVSHALSGQSAFVQLTIPQAIELQPTRTHQVPVKVTEPQPETLHVNRTQIVSPTRLPAVTSYSASNPPTVIADLETIFWSAATLDQLQLAPKEANWSPSAAVPASGRFIATAVAPRGQAAEKARKFSSMIGQGKSLDQLIDQGLWWLDRQQAENNPPRIGFAFSGQGSQYGGMLSAVAKQFPQAQQVIHQADQILQKLDGSSFAQIAWSAEHQLGENVWQTQAALLVADTMLGNVVRSFGIEPELGFGHSYGEIPAMLAAGSIDLESAIHLTWHRCQCVTQNAPSGCSMLSVQADAETVTSAINNSHLPLTISHINAPLQTVVGGKHSHIAQLAALLDDAGITSRILPVPTAFHTPALQAAVAPFRQALNRIAICPPRLPLLSSVNNRFMADPDWMRAGLAEQLVTPLRFVELLQKVVASGITHLIEIGPQRVLTRLSRASETGMQVFASDYGPQGENNPLALMPLGLLAAFAQMTTGIRSAGYADDRVPNTLRQSGVQTLPAGRADSSGRSNTTEIKSFDATTARRTRMRSASSMTRELQPNLPVNLTNTRVNSLGLAPATSPIVPTVSVPSKSQPEPMAAASQSTATTATEAMTPALLADTTTSDTSTNANGPAAEQVQQILIDFVVEQTGYPAEIVELDADLEADLGIDSIKKAQLMGELRELFPQALAAMQSKEGKGDARAQGNRLAQLRTLRNFVELICVSTGSATKPSVLPSTAQPASQLNSSPTAASGNVQTANVQTAKVQTANVQKGSVQTASVQTPNVQAPSHSSPVVSAAPGLTRRNLEQFVIDFVVEQTGYPAEIVELNADLEADLGIDSIKKAQLLGELRETFAFQLSSTSETGAGQSSRSKGSLDQLRTLNQILDVLSAQLGVSTSQASLSTSTEEPQSSQPASSQAPLPSTANHSKADSQFEAAEQFEADSQSESAAKKISPEPQTEPHESRAASAFVGVPVYTANHRNGFGDAIRQNLRAFPGRVSQTRIQNPPKSSRRMDIAQELAQYAEVQAETLLTFDQVVLSQSKWTVLPPQSQVDSTSSIHFILELELPAWLAEGDCSPLGMKSDDKGTVQVLTPGSITPSVVIDSKNNLIAIHAAELETKFELANSIDSLVALEATTIESQIRSRNLAGDWWILVVDTKRLTVDHWQMRNQIFSHASCGLNRWSGNDTISAGSSSKLGFDTASQTWNIVARNKSLTKPSRQAVKEANTGVRERVGASASAETGQRSSLGNGQASSGVDNENNPRMYEELNFFAAFATPDTEDALCEQPATSPDECRPVSQQQEEASPRTIQADLATVETLEQADSSQSADSSDIAQRYILRLAPAPQMAAPGRQPTFSGTAVVVGDNPIANQLESRLRATGVEVIRMIADGSSETQLAEQFAAMANTTRLPHLFITSPCDADARITLELPDWQRRRNVGLMNIFWLCQRWFDHITSLNITDDASLIAVSSMGGDFGISGDIHSVEGGGINGLLKSILIESWMQGYRSLPIKTIDSHPQQSPAEIVNIVWRELAIPSYDNEIAYVSGTRHILKAIPRSSSSVVGANERSAKLSERKPLRSITRGGNWVFTGGARGITALVAERLATRYGLTLHLIGTAPSPNIDPAWRNLDAEGLRQLKLQVMTEARQIGKNPVKHWQDTEKQMEIDATLRRLSGLGVQVHYHSCDVADRAGLLETLQFIRQISGPITGVVHGAGVGRDARFDRKQPEKVHQCIAAKVDGALSLMQATWHDPLEVFVGFGSISGRFGANGHTDYSLSNEMLCKQIDWLKRQRPDVRAIGFHWHAWGDVGMATKPETKLALEMIHMQFMPAEEGIQHLIRELEADANESEVLITDDRYYRAFYPAETLIEAKSSVAGAIETPLLIPVAASTASTASDANTADQAAKSWLATVHPVKDPFLAEHLLDGAPLLPFVVATEMLREAAAAYFSSNNILLRDITAHGAVRFFSDSAQDLTLVASGSGDRSQIELRSDFVSRKGIVVDRNRLNFSVQAVSQTSPVPTRGSVQLPTSEVVEWLDVHYPDADAEFYVGWPLQKLRKVAILNEGLLGKISAPALIELAGVTRSTKGWTVPSAALDACLFAVGILAWQRIAPGSALPVRMGELRLGRLPKPGEALMVHVVMNEARQGSASFDFSLYGVDGNLIVDVMDYEVAWLQRSTEAQNSSAESQQG